MATPFIAGLELARQFHAEVVGPLLNQSFPGITYSAALIGWGSDVLGFDSARSTDHNWGPRLQVFLAPGDADRAAEITGLMASRLPATFRGWPTAFPDATTASPEPRHWVEVAELGSWLAGQLGFDPRDGVTLLDWLATPAQRLAEATAGAVFHTGWPPRAAPGRPTRTAPVHLAGLAGLADLAGLAGLADLVDLTDLAASAPSGPGSPVSAGRLAVRARLPVAADQPGGSVSRPVRRGSR